MNVPKLIISILAITFGIFMIVYGEMDDSPGGQGLGLIAVIFGIVGMVKGKRK
jgi:drug/metabolite transporter (DMT)-like permease